MILRIQLLKHFFYNCIFNNHESAIYFRKKNNGFIGVTELVDVSDDVTSIKAKRRVNDKMF